MTSYTKLEKMIIMQKMSGVTLAIALIFLALLTILGVVAMQSGIFQIKISSNMRDSQLSFQATESAIRDAENWLANTVGKPSPVVSCTTQPCVLFYDPLRNAQNQNQAWWVANSAAYSGAVPTGVKTTPYYFIEYLRYVPDDLTIGLGYSFSGTDFYRVTARGTGGSDDAVTVLQATFGRRF